MENILFLGIEGVLDHGWHQTIYDHSNRKNPLTWKEDFSAGIPGMKNRDSSFSFKVQDLDTCAMKVLLQLCQETNCKIVFNTTAKFPLHESSMGPGFLYLFEGEGFTISNHLHPMYETSYSDDGEDDKVEAAYKWLAANHHSLMNWTMLDSEYLDHPKAFQVPLWPGLCMNAYMHCLECFGMEKYNPFYKVAFPRKKSIKELENFEDHRSTAP